MRSSVEITDALLSCEAAVDREVFQRDEAIAQEAARRHLALSDVRRTVFRLDASFEETQARTASAVVGLTGQSHHHSGLLCELQRGVEYLQQAVLHAGQFGLTASEIWSKDREALGNRRLLQLMFAEWSMSGFGSRRVSTRAIVRHLIRIDMEVAELDTRTVDCEYNVARLSGDDVDRDSDMERHDLCVSLADLPAPAESLPLVALRSALVSTLHRERALVASDLLGEVIWAWRSIAATAADFRWKWQEPHLIFVFRTWITFVATARARSAGGLSADLSTGAGAASTQSFDDQVRGVVEDMLSDEVNSHVQELLSSHWASLGDLFDEYKEELLLGLRESTAELRTGSIVNDSESVDNVRDAPSLDSASSTLRVDPRPATTSTREDLSPEVLVGTRSTRRRAARAKARATHLGEGRFPDMGDCDLDDAFENPGGAAHQEFLRQMGFFD